MVDNKIGKSAGSKFSIDWSIKDFVFRCSSRAIFFFFCGFFVVVHFSFLIFFSGNFVDVIGIRPKNRKNVGHNNQPDDNWMTRHALDHSHP